MIFCLIYGVLEEIKGVQKENVKLLSWLKAHWVA